MEQFMMNNCKIANELRKYRDLTGCINRVSLSDDPDNYAEYVVTQELSYLDMVTANAVYSLWRSGEGENGFGAETIGKIMAGDMSRRLRREKREEMEARLRRLAGTEIYILADHDQQAAQGAYEGPILSLDWEEVGSGLRFRFRPGGQMPLYQYAEERNQLIRIPIALLRDDKTLGQTRLNNSDQTLLLRHYLLQELEIIHYPSNRVDQRELRLLKRDEYGDEYGILWILGLLGDGQAQTTEAKRAQQVIAQLMDNWRKSGYVTEDQYQFLSAEKGYGILLLRGDKAEKKRNKKEKK
ncbi:hypothetical protein [uncultured Pseudoflavonifractor sp.]|uniref:hypothetical protein n=1 Tax=uncultured Pseudoflavonifractor sp. TaxID=1221379 RepID=UPI0025E8CE43|nr:hypothetical protein [uncultured Pseudoflavonifractor sp.]